MYNIFLEQHLCENEQNIFRELDLVTECTITEEDSEHLALLFLQS